MKTATLAIDVGNSRTKFGLFECRPAGRNSRPVLPLRMESGVVDMADDLPWDRIRTWIGNASNVPINAVIAGSNPDRIAELQSAWPADCVARPLCLTTAADVRIAVDVDEPSTVGMDRLLTAVAANVIRPPTRPAIVIDSGTATTVNLIAADGTFQGGAILPGVMLGSRALHHYTAQLPFVTVAELGDPLPALPGRNTRDAIRNGLFRGHLGALREIVAAMPVTSPPVIYLTGGAAKALAPHIGDVIHKRFLALQGAVIAAGNDHSSNQ